MRNLNNFQETGSTELANKLFGDVIGPGSPAMMVSAGNGYAQACATPSIGTVIGKAIENFDGDQGIIEIVVGRI